MLILLAVAFSSPCPNARCSVPGRRYRKAESASCGFICRRRHVPGGGFIGARPGCGQDHRRQVARSQPGFRYARLMTRRERAKERVSDATSTASERMSEAKTAAGERMSEARSNAAERVTDARAAASERVSDAKSAAEDLIEKSKPKLRGVTHEWAFFISLVAGG